MIGMSNFFFFLHILGAVAAFGPGFAFPFIGAIGSKTPGSFPLIAKLGEALGKKLIIPMAVLVLISGLGMVYTREINLIRSPWLLAALLIFLGALTISLGVQLPTATKLARIAEQQTQPGPPPPEAMALVKRQRITGMVLLLLFIVVLALMVFKPGGTTGI